MQPTQQDIQNILKLQNFFQFASGPDSNHFFGACENIHNLIHNFSGGQNPNFGKPGMPNEPQFGYMQSAGTHAGMSRSGPTTCRVCRPASVWPRRARTSPWTTWPA